MIASIQLTNETLVDQGTDQQMKGHASLAAEPLV